jgi:hypothetical protein
LRRRHIVCACDALGDGRVVVLHTRQRQVKFGIPRACAPPAMGSEPEDSRPRLGTIFLEPQTGQ